MQLFDIVPIKLRCALLEQPRLVEGIVNQVHLEAIRLNLDAVLRQKNV